ncbi:hypothetical protein Z043-101264 [Arapaima gigas]
MAEDGGNPSEDRMAREAEGSSSLPRTFIRLNDLSGNGERGEADAASPGGRESAAAAAAEETSAAGGDPLPYPSLAPVVFFYLKQTTRPRKEGERAETSSKEGPAFRLWLEKGLVADGVKRRRGSISSQRHCLQPDCTGSLVMERLMTACLKQRCCSSSQVEYCLCLPQTGI